MITSSILHVDPRPERAYNSSNKNRPIDNIILHNNFLNAIKNANYPLLDINSSSGKISITNPLFGSDLYIIIYQERQLEKFKGKVIESNKVSMDNYIDNMEITMFGSSYMHEFNEIECLNKKICILTEELVHKLLLISRPTFLESKFNKTIFNLKNQITIIIKDSEDIYNGAQKNNADFIIYALPWAKDMKIKISVAYQDLPHEFIKQIFASIDGYINQVHREISTNNSIKFNV